MWKKVRGVLIGAPKDVHSEHTFHSISLVAMLAWVGLGADGLSSSAYGPEAAFRELVANGNDYTSLAVGLAAGTALTVFIISYAYSRIIEHFPSGGGGYLVATKLLGPRVGVVSGSALLVDYVLTITVSIASGGDAVFSMIPRSLFGAEATRLSAEDIGTWLDPVQRTKLIVEAGAIAVLTVLNIRGVKESVQAILPVFMAFVVTHVILLAVAIFGHLGDVGTVTRETGVNFHHTVASLGMFGALMLFVRAYSLGGGTYTGIEAVSNGVQIMREPKVRTAKNTMSLMATSLAASRGGRHRPLLPARARDACRRQDDECRPPREGDRPLARRRVGGRQDVHHDRPRVRGRAAAHRRAGGLQPSTDRASWPTWPSTRGCRTASPPSRSA